MYTVSYVINATPPVQATNTDGFNNASFNIASFKIDWSIDLSANQKVELLHNPVR